MSLNLPPPEPLNHGYQWRHILALVLPHRRELIIAHCVALCVALLSVPIPLLIPLLVDEVLLHQPSWLVASINHWFPESWHGATLSIVAVTVFTVFLRFCVLLLGVVQMRQFTIIAKSVIFNMRKTLVLRLQRVSMREYETLGSGQIISHLVTDLDTLDQFLGVSISRLLIASLSIIGTAIVLLWMHWQLALIILLVNPLVVYSTIKLGRKVKTLKKAENHAYAHFQQVLTETLEAIQQIRANNRESYYLNRVIDAAGEMRQHSVAYTWKTDAATRLSFNVFVVGFDVFRALGMFMVLLSDLTIGEMLAVFAYLWFMLAPMQEILNIQYAYHSAKGALSRINQLFDLHWEPRYPARCNPFQDKTTASIRLEKVSFSYDGQTPVLDQISLNIAAGEKVAVVGASGGGKTTLVQLLLGLYQPQSGQIYFNEAPITEIGLNRVREHVVTVLQHPALFNDTVRMNLTLGQDFPDEVLWHALEVAQLRETIAAMDNGLDTLLGQRGVRLSGGQRQRVAIARMILANPKVVILDEATSALDTETEHHLHAALTQFLRDRTTLIIAHRLSAVRQADRVYVFDEGKIIEEGRHEHLLQNDGVYARLYGHRQRG